MTTNYHHILAPTPVATTILNTAPAVVTNMQNHIRAQQDKQNRQTNVIANMSDWRIWESTNLFDNVLLDISNFINNKLAFKFKNKNYTKLEFVDAWTNLYIKGDYTRHNEHIPSTYSFVYCVKADDNSYPLVFSSVPEFSVNLTTDMLVVFPSHLIHYVPVLQSDDERMILAGNLSPKKEDMYD